jgi:RHS repeat-associated protein
VRGDADGREVAAQRFLFTGKEIDEETGLYYFGARYYDPVRARWASADPALIDSPGLMLERQRELNAYGYAALNPVALVDPDGRCAVGAGMQVDCAAPGEEMLAAGVEQAAQGIREGSVSDTALGLATATFGTLSASAGTVIDWTVGFAWNAGVKYGTGADQLVASGGMDSGPLLEGSTELLLLGAGGKLVTPASAGATAAARGTQGVLSRIVHFTQRNLQKGFTKHGADFGLSGKWNPNRAVEFSRAVNQHINRPGIRTIAGTYRGNPATHYLDPKTGLNVIADPAGNYVSGWRLGAEQLKSVRTTGRLF